MNRFLLFLVVMATTVLAGCDKGDDGNSTPNPPTDEPTLEGYIEPYMKWGATRQEVKKAVPYELITDSQSGLTYKGVGIVSAYIYTFTGPEDNSLGGSTAMVDGKHVEELTDFIYDKYTFLYADESTYSIFFTNKDKSLMVVLMITGSDLMVMYMANTTNTALINKVPNPSSRASSSEMYYKILQNC